jgi:hypothetical protein
MTTPTDVLNPLGLKRAYERECRRVPGFKRVSERFLSLLRDVGPTHSHVSPALALYCALRDTAALACPQQALDAAVTLLARELDIVTPDADPVPQRLDRLRQRLLASDPSTPRAPLDSEAS